MRVLFAFVLLLACGPGDDRRVPFQDTPRDPDTPETPEDREAPFEPAIARVLPAGTERIGVQGAELTGAGSDLGALLTADVDADGDLDAFALAFEAETGTLGLLVARREGERFVSRPLGRKAFGPGCAMDEVALRRATPATVIAEARLRCPEPVAEDAPDAAPELGPPQAVRLVVSFEAAPRLLERFVVRGGDVGLTLTLEPGDLDDDGHEDLRARLLVRPPGADERTVELRWMSRANGLTRASDEAEPGATLDAVIASESGATAERFGKTLCAGPEAQIEVGPSRGLPCPEGWARRAALVSLRAALERGELGPALARAAALDASAEELGLSPTEGLAQRALGPAAGVGLADARHGALAFEADGTLAVAGRPPFVIELPSARRRPGERSRAPVGDAAGALALRGVSRSCEGYVAELVGTGALRLLPPKRVLVAAAPLSPCPAVPPSDDGGWRVLGWAPQGLLASRAGDAPDRWLVSLTASGDAVAAPSRLPPRELPPVPLRGGRTTPDGRTWVLETRYGVLRFSGGTAALWRPEGWDALDDAPVAAALSADGRRVAVLRGGTLWLLGEDVGQDAPDSDEDTSGAGDEPATR